MSDGLEVGGDEPELTRDDYARILFLSPLPAFMPLLICDILINIALIQAQGGADRIRHDLREHAIEAEKLRRKQDEDRLNEEWIHGWDEHRRNPGDDNYAK